MLLKDMMTQINKKASGIKFVGQTSGVSLGTASITLDLTNLTDGIDTTAREGDMVLLSMSYADTNAVYLTYPSGFNNISADSIKLGNLFYVTRRIGFKIMGSTPDTTLTITGNTVNNRGSVASVIVLRGTDITEPLWTSSKGTNTFDWVIPTITPDVDGSMIVTFATIHRPDNITEFTSTTLDYIQNSDVSASTTSVCMGVGYLENVTSGSPISFGNATYVGTSIEDGYAGYISISLEVKPE